ncbi:hypothetical protein DLH72_04085 [Candidatus Gracilibacteria bacterium]|nr:MAG: hypothetical protein DLH72_04085 [Candidatus Gracilibacteria bacterium]
MVNKIEQNIVPEKQDGSDKESAIMKIKTGTKAALLALGLSVVQNGQAQVIEEPELGENEMEVIVGGNRFVFNLKEDPEAVCDPFLEKDDMKTYENCLVGVDTVYEVIGDITEQELAQARERRIQSEKELSQARERRTQSEKELAQSEKELVQAIEDRKESEKHLLAAKAEANKVFQEMKKEAKAQ